MAASYRLTTDYADEQLCYYGHANGTLWNSVFSSENTQADWFLICRFFWKLNLKMLKVPGFLLCFIMLGLMIWHHSPSLKLCKTVFLAMMQKDPGIQLHARYICVNLWGSFPLVPYEQTVSWLFKAISIWPKMRLILLYSSLYLLRHFLISHYTSSLDILKYVC